MQLQDRTVFKPGGMEKLGFEYVPPRLPHREDKLEYLSKMLSSVLEDPSSITRRILIVGETGTGKTATTKRFGESIEAAGRSKGLSLKYAHVNCRLVSGKFGLVQAIIRQTAPELPLRGYGPSELLHALWDYLNDRDTYVILTLDEIDHYVRTTGDDIVLELINMTDAVSNVPQRFSFLFIARDHSFIDAFKPSTLSKFAPQDKLEFQPYNENELKDILRERVNDAFLDSTVSDEIVEFVARNCVTLGHGDARYALQLLFTAGLIADREGSRNILPEHVREAQSRTDPRLRDEDVATLPTDQQILLLAVARCLRTNKETIYLTSQELEKTYRLVCEEHEVKNVGRALIQALIRNLQTLGILDINEKKLIELRCMRAEILEKFLEDLLRQQKHVPRKR